MLATAVHLIVFAGAIQFPEYSSAPHQHQEYSVPGSGRVNDFWAGTLFRRWRFFPGHRGRRIHSHERDRSVGRLNALLDGNPTSDFQVATNRTRLILCAVRWNLRYSLSFRYVEELLEERGLKTDHTTVWR